MKKTIAGLLVAASCVLAAPHVAVSIGVGVPVAPVGVYAAAPAPVVAAIPPCPGPGYTWVAGTWLYAGGRRTWHAGYWAPPVAHFHGYARFHR
jgi:hypothetical protein